MIGKIFGIIEDICEDHLLIKVSCGISYIVYCAKKTLNLLSLKDEIELFIQTDIKEDRLDLYGFTTKDEKMLFNLLNLVKGVGKKMSLNIISQSTYTEIRTAISTKNIDFFKKITGVGPNLAERIITELKNKILKLYKFEVHNPEDSQNNLLSNAVEALTILGIKKQEAFQRVNKILQENSKIELNELVKLSIKS